MKSQLWELHWTQLFHSTHMFLLSDEISTLGVTLDSTPSFNSHVSNVCKASYSHLQALKYIHLILTKDIALYIAVALVQSRLDIR
jgi:hypothetical protein